MNARRTNVTVTFSGIDVSSKVGQGLLSLSYIDNEFGEADDLQVKLEDESGIWLTKWLNSALIIGSAKSSDFTVGDAVIVNGAPKYASYGGGDDGVPATVPPPPLPLQHRSSRW